MKTNIEDITNKVSYAKIYDALNSIDDNLSLDYLMNADNVFNIIDDKFYSVLSKQAKPKYSLLTYASMLSTNKSYMSMYLFSFVLSSLDEFVNYSNNIVKNIKSFYSNTKEQNIIMLKSFNKILNIYSGVKSQIKDDKLLYSFIIESLDVNLIKDILSFSKINNFNNVVSFINVIVDYKHYYFYI